MSPLLTIDPVTRIEGHLSVKIDVDTVGGVQQVVDAWSTGTLFRGFEIMLIGRDPRDAQHITQRVCGVCPTPHAMAAVNALDNAYGITVPLNALHMRNLVLGANFIQSHILHFYILSLLDYMSGANMPVWKPSYQTDLRINFADYTGTLQLDAPPRYIGFRALHRPEGGRQTPNGMPCVIPSLNVTGIEFTRDMQLLSYELVRYMDPEKWRVVYGYGTAFCNQNGFNKSDDPRRDYVNERDLTAEYPKLMKAIVCAGNFFTGHMIGGELVCTPGVDAIDGNKPMPSMETVIQRHWYFIATTAKYDSTGVWRVNNFPQGGGRPVLIPYILRLPTYYTGSFFERWEGDVLPDPLKVYNPLGMTNRQA